MRKKVNKPELPPPNCSSCQIDNQADLASWLAASGIDVTAWGQGTTKSVANLWDEFVKGEMSLQNSPPLRIVQVVQVIIRQGDRILIEAGQEFGDHRQRARHHPPSEKLESGETHQAAALRCLEEELGVQPQAVQLIHATYRQRQTETDSLSYPGLKSRYQFHIIEARVEGLPSIPFWTTETDTNLTDPVKKHYWTWEMPSAAE